jgi:hypothetical protein
VEPLPSKHDILSSNPSTAKEKKGRKEGRKKGGREGRRKKENVV